MENSSNIFLAGNLFNEGVNAHKIATDPAISSCQPEVCEMCAFLIVATDVEN